jgi:uroporphyrinogen decarboxylase
MGEMTKRERIQAVLAGKPVDRLPVAFWRHWPIDDQDPEALARATLDYQRRFDWDLLKVTPSHTYCVDDYGAKHAYRGRLVGDRDHTERVVKRIEDWDRIQPLDVRAGALGRQLTCLRLVIEKREPDTPVIQTLFDPITMARFLADDAYIIHFRRDPDRVGCALRALTETCSALARAAIAEGADGIFLSTMGASYEVMAPEEYRRFGRPGDQAVLEAARGGWLNILHLHGQHPMVSEVADYPIHALSWHDRTAGPSLSETAQIFPGTLVAGVEQFSVLHFEKPDAVEAQVKDAIAQTGGRRLIVAAGCTYPLTAPECNLVAARRAVEKAARETVAR